MAFRFYLHRVITQAAGAWLDATSGLTRYLTLLNHLLDWHEETGAPARLATFNYDVLLDSAVSALVVGWHLLQLPDYVGREDFRLFKLHGSTTWSRVIPTEMSQGTLTITAAMALAAENELSGGEIMARYPEEQVGITRYDPSAVGGSSEITLPAMAVPMAAKTDFECPPEHIEALRADLPSVTHVLIVGWRAAEPHAVELLAGFDPQSGLMPSFALGLVSGREEDAEEVRGNLRGVWGKGRLRFLEPDGFSTFTQRIDEHLGRFLARA